MMLRPLPQETLPLRFLKLWTSSDSSSMVFHSNITPTRYQNEWCVSLVSKEKIRVRKIGLSAYHYSRTVNQFKKLPRKFRRASFRQIRGCPKILDNFRSVRRTRV